MGHIPLRETEIIHWHNSGSLRHTGPHSMSRKEEILMGNETTRITKLVCFAPKLRSHKAPARTIYETHNHRHKYIVWIIIHFVDLSNHAVHWNTTLVFTIVLRHTPWSILLVMANLYILILWRWQAELLNISCLSLFRVAAVNCHVEEKGWVMWCENSAWLWFHIGRRPHTSGDLKNILLSRPLWQLHFVDNRFQILYS